MLKSANLVTHTEKKDSVNQKSLAIVAPEKNANFVTWVTFFGSLVTNFVTQMTNLTNFVTFPLVARSWTINIRNPGKNIQKMYN
jgi:hypothetical protein